MGQGTRAAVVNGVMVKSVEAGGETSPKHEHLGAGEGGHTHGFKAVAHSVQHRVKYTFCDDRVRSRVLAGDAAKHGAAPMEVP